VVFGSPVSKDPASLELFEPWEVVDALLLGTGAAAAAAAAGCWAGGAWDTARCLYLWRSSRSSWILQANNY